MRRIARAVRALFRKNRMERELEAELRFHLDRQTELNVGKGLPPEEARRQALRHFGVVEAVKDDVRDAWSSRLAETFLQDLRFGARSMLKNPGFTLVAVLTLALGIGVNTAIFSVVYNVLLRPLPYRQSDRLVVVRQKAPLARVDNMPFSCKEIADYRQASTLERIAEYHSMTFILLGRSEAERVQTGVVSADFFDMLGVRPILGRTFVPADDQPGAEAVLVLSYGYWQRSHGADPNVVGKTFKMNDRVHTVIGVLPPVPQHPNENDVYMPTSACPFRSAPAFVANRNARMMTVLGRLRGDARVEHAQNEIGTIASRLAADYPESYPKNRGYGATAVSLQQDLTRRAQPTFLMLLGTAGLVLLIACANVGNLTLARVVRREREMAIRAALGAGRGRLIRQLLTESVLLAVAGGIVGLLLAAGSLDLLVSFAARFTTRAAEITLNPSVLAFTVVVSCFTGIGFGLVPAFASGANLMSSIKDGAPNATSGPGRQRLRGVLVVAQVSISFMLLIAAGLLLRSLWKLERVNPGFDAVRVLSMQIVPNWSKHRTPAEFRGFYTRVLEQVEGTPGIVSAAISTSFPLNQSAPANNAFQIEGRPVAEGEPRPLAEFRSISSRYFETIGIPLVEGRFFTAEDHDEAPGVAIVNQAMVRHRFPGETAVGRQIVFGRDRKATIIGVVADSKQRALDQEPADEVYLPFAQNPGGQGLLVRTTADPLSMVRQLRDAVHEVDSESAVASVQTLEQARTNSLASPRLTAVLVGLFAALALGITVAGISGVMALSVSQRRHEIGVRMALGATSVRVVGMVLGQGMRLVVVGLVLGVAGAFGLTRVFATLLFAVEPTDPPTFVAVASVLVAGAAAACLLPARRATGIDPLLALRSE
jgi:predicted permease